MEIKRKTMSRDEWPGKENKRIIINNEIINGNDALIGFIWWTKGVDKVIVDKKQLLIVDEDYSWLEIAIDGQYYWITAMYDNNDNFIEAYFDINFKNELNKEDPYFLDMFTDIIISHDRTVHILDEDELEQALDEGLIDYDDYHHGRRITKELYEYVSNNVDVIMDYLNNKHKEYKDKMIENMI